MKRLLLGIGILVLVVFASSVMAAGPKVPKNLCFDFDTYGDYALLLLKTQGNITTSSGKLKVYSITGHTANMTPFPVQGSAYVVPPGTILHATYNGQFGSSTQNPASYELFFDLATNTGTIYYHYEAKDSASAITGSDTVTALDCGTMAMPSAAPPVASDKTEGGTSTGLAH